MPTLGEKLVEIRENKGLSQKALADLLNITPTRLNYWEKDKRQPDIEMIKRIASVLDVSFSSLLNWDEQYNPNGKLEKEVKTIEEVGSCFGESAILILKNFTSLNDFGQSKALEYISDLAEQEKYQKSTE